MPNVDPKALHGELLTTPGATFDQSAMDRTIERLTLAVSEQGFAFARVRPRAAREPGTRAINVTYVIDQGPRIYIERINIIGNLRTLDYVVRREFRLAEGDAYNPLMVDKAKKRLQALGFFKARGHQAAAGNGAGPRRPRCRAGRAVDGRAVLRRRLLDQRRRDRRRQHHRAQPAGQGSVPAPRLAGSAERMQIDLSFTEPRFLDRNLAAGFDLFHKDDRLSPRSAVPSPRRRADRCGSASRCRRTCG